jgi:hypothetical protein
MFTQEQNPKQEQDESQAKEADIQQNKYKNVINLYSVPNNEVNYNTIDNLLEKEKQHNKNETWIKLDKIIKIQKLHQYAEKYGRDHGLPVKDVKSLKSFFVDCLEKNKLNKTKDVIYNKDTKEVTSIPALYFNQTNRAFTLKIIDAKRVSTVKSLTPKRLTEKNKEAEVEIEEV